MGFSFPLLTSPFSPHISWAHVPNKLWVSKPLFQGLLWVEAWISVEGQTRDIKRATLLWPEPGRFLVLLELLSTPSSHWKFCWPSNAYKTKFILYHGIWHPSPSFQDIPLLETQTHYTACLSYFLSHMYFFPQSWNLISLPFLSLCLWQSLIHISAQMSIIVLAIT